jgi:hypothetical protein
MAAVAMVEESPETESIEMVEKSIEAMEDEMTAAEQEMKAAEIEMDRARRRMERAVGEQEMRAAEKEMDRAVKKIERAAERMDRAAQKIAREHEVDARRSYRHVLKKAVSERLHPLAMVLATGDGHAGGVLVIPAEQIETKRLVTIMEDLTVMSRILDKKLGRSQNDPLFGTLSALSDARGGTQCIYLDGYGALFIIKVDFPLTPSVRAQDEEETEEPTDRVWEETRQEILAGPGVIRRRKIRVQPDKEHRYDAEKVEELKRNLIKSLRHAANIRNLEAGEWVIFTVMGEGSLPGEAGGCGRCHQPCEGESEAARKGCPLATVMTIRVDKSDVDAFAAGELDLDEFRETVQIYTY